MFSDLHFPLTKSLKLRSCRSTGMWFGSRSSFDFVASLLCPRPVSRDGVRPRHSSFGCGSHVAFGPVPAVPAPGELGGRVHGRTWRSSGLPTTPGFAADYSDPD